jgi:hypothetical protein
MSAEKVIGDPSRQRSSFAFLRCGRPDPRKSDGLMRRCAVRVLFLLAIMRCLLEVTALSSCEFYTSAIEVCCFELCLNF